MSITQNGACRSPKSEHAEHFWVARGEKLALVNLKNVASLPPELHGGSDDNCKHSHGAVRLRCSLRAIEIPTMT